MPTTERLQGWTHSEIVSAYAYDAASRQRRVVNSLGHMSTTLYDSDNRVVASINALGYRTSFAYDAASQQIHVRDANLQDYHDALRPRRTQLGYNQAPLCGARLKYTISSANRLV